MNSMSRTIIHNHPMENLSEPEIPDDIVLIGFLKMTGKFSTPDTITVGYQKRWWGIGRRQIPNGIEPFLWQTTPHPLLLAVTNEWGFLRS